MDSEVDEVDQDPDMVSNISGGSATADKMSVEMNEDIQASNRNM